LRILDSDILSYALYDESPAHPYAWGVLERGLSGEIDLHLTHTTILETCNVLFWFYRVRPLRSLLEKLRLAIDGLKVVEPSITGLGIASSENIPLGDGFLIATALSHRIPIIVSNDLHVADKGSKYGLIVENPIPQEARKKLIGFKTEDE